MSGLVVDQAVAVVVDQVADFLAPVRHDAEVLAAIRRVGIVVEVVGQAIAHRAAALRVAYADREREVVAVRLTGPLAAVSVVLVVVEVPRLARIHRADALLAGRSGEGETV